MFCKNCGKEFEGKFCPECGTKAEIDADVLTKCPECGTERIESSSFCINCGFNFKTGQALQQKVTKDSVQKQPSKFVTNFPSLFAKIYRYLGSSLSLFMGIFGFICLAMPTLVINFLGMSDSIGSGYEAMSGNIDPSLTAACIIVLLLSIGYFIFGAIQLAFAIKRPYKLVKNIVCWIISGVMLLTQFILGCVVAGVCGGDEFAGAKLGGCFACCIAFGIIGLVLLGLSIFYEIKFFKIADTGLTEEEYAKSKEKIDVVGTIKKIDKKLLVRIGAPIFAVVMIVAIVVPVSLWAVNIFRAGKVDMINIGDTQEQVEKVLGKPFKQNDYKWEYYDKKYVKLTKQIDKLVNEDNGLSVVKSKEDEDLDDIFGDLESNLGKLEKLETQLNNLVYEYIKINFDSNNKVVSVILDKSKCDKLDYENVKEVKKHKLSEKKYVAFVENDIVVCTTYKDGSFYKKQLDTIPLDYALNSDGDYIKTENDFEYSWTDPWGNEFKETFTVKSKNNKNIVKLLIYEDFYLTIDKKSNIIVYDINKISDKVSPCVNKRDLLGKLYESYGHNDNFAKATLTCDNKNTVFKVENKCLVNTKTNSLIFGIQDCTIPNGIVTIEEYAFRYCEFNSLFIPESVVVIDKYAFEKNPVSIENIYCETESYRKNWDISFSGERYWNYGYTLVNVDNTSYYIKDNVAKIAKVNEEIVGEYSIPDKITYENKEYVVKYISDNAFYKQSSMTSINLSNNIVSIGKEALYGCSSLTSITIGSNIVSIGERAFRYCDKLNKVFITDIAKWCNIIFEDSDSNPLYNAHNLYLNETLITNIAIPSTLTKINDYAFYACTSIKNITIPNSVTKIGNSAFYNCSNLATISIGDRVTFIGNDAFRDCEKLQYNEYSETLYLGNAENPYVVLVKAKSTDITSLTINEKTKLIQPYAFNNCRNLNSVTIPNSVNIIGAYAFQSCTGLTSVGMGNSVKSIGMCAFESCISFESITIPKSVAIIGDNAFSNCNGLTIYCEIASEPSDWTKYWNNSSNPVVWDCNDNEIAEDGYLYQIINGIKYMLKGNEAIVARNSKTLGGDIKIPESVTYKDIIYRVTSIGHNAFYDCDDLTSITILDNIISIDDYAFYGCDNLKYNEYDNALYLGNDSNPYLALVKPKATNITNCIVNEKTKIIADSAFSYCSSLTSINIPNSVTNIGNSAFYDCISLTSVTIGSGVTSIGYYVFGLCTSLANLTIGNGVTNIDADAFIGCDSLKYNEYSEALYLGNAENPYLVLVKAKSYYISNCTINENTKLIAEGAFNHCNLMTSIAIPNSVTIIGDYAFQLCSGLKSVNIGNSVTSIGKSAFEQCSSLASITIPNSVTSIGSSAFSVCSSLTSITIPNSVTSIGEEAFRGSGLKSVTIGNGVTSIGKEAFSGCYYLRTFKFNGTKAEWKSISKGYDWNGSHRTRNFKITCIDGRLNKNA